MGSKVKMVLDNAHLSALDEATDEVKVVQAVPDSRCWCSKPAVRLQSKPCVPNKSIVADSKLFSPVDVL